MLNTSRIILGTAQLGLTYGVANRTGQPDQATANLLIASAWEKGLRTFDTAYSYGVSETVLGKAFRTLGLAEPNVVSKLPVIMGPGGKNMLKEIVASSLERLGLSSLYCLMLHEEKQLPLLDGALGDAVEEGLKDGLFHSFGISVYEPSSALAALRHPLISIVQIPANIFDRRFEAEGVFSLAAALGKELHIRSAFLQGVICMLPHELPASVARLAPFIWRLQELCTENRLSVASVALAWLLDRYIDAKILFGAETPWQVRENLDFLNRATDAIPDLRCIIDDILPPQTPSLLNPSFWETL